MYRPKAPFTVAYMLLNPTYEKMQGRNIATYPEEGEVIKGNFLSFGGTLQTVNGVLAIENTANVETWYNPNIRSDSRLKRMEDGKVFEIMGEPEDIELRHQFLKFKVEALRGSTNG